MCSREIFTKKCRQQQIFDSDLKGAWHYNHVISTPIAKNFMSYCRLIYMLSILCVRLTIKVKVGIPESFKVGWYPPKKLGRVTLNHSVGDPGGWFQTCVKVRTTLPFSNSLPLINVHPCKYVHMCSWKTSFEAKRVIRGSVSHWFYFLTPRKCCMSSSFAPILQNNLLTDGCYKARSEPQDTSPRFSILP